MGQGRPLPGGSILLPLIFLALFSVGFVSPVNAAETPRVEDTAAIVVGDRPIPPIVRTRMERTVAAIAAERMEGRHTADIVTSEEEEVIGAVFDRLLVGYAVTGVTVRPASHTTVEIHLAPWADTIQRVTVETQVEGMPPMIEEMVRADLSGADQVSSDALIGLPVAATDWAAGALKRQLSAYMENHLPEFRADYDIDVSSAATVHLTVYPRLPVVRTIDLSMRSDTVPNAALLTQRTAMETEVNRLVGVPVAFAARHRTALENQLGAHLDAVPALRSLHITSHVTITPGEHTAVMSRSDTDRYRLRLTGWLDIGRASKGRGEDRRDLHARLHVGRMFSPRDELYVETDAAPEDVRFSWRTGYARTLLPGLTGELRWDVSGGRFSAAGSYAFHPRWLLRYEHWTDVGTGEWELRYKLHDFLSIAGLIDRDDALLRLIGNF